LPLGTVRGREEADASTIKHQAHKSNIMKTISRITIRYNGNGITADGTHQNAGTINPTEAIEKANAWAASDKGHVDFVGGQYDVWADYEDGDSEHIHSTNIIA
jgi:hypothetical protein